MATIAEKLLHLDGTKTEIRTAIEEKGVDVPLETPFRDYADKIREITAGEDADADPDGMITGDVFSCGGLQLGTGSGSRPVNKSSANIAQVAVGADSTLAIDADGKLYGTGMENYGQLGTGYVAAPTRSVTGWVRIGTFTDAYKIAKGNLHALMIRKTWNVDKWDYTLWATGRNNSGQLGAFSLADQGEFAQVGTDTDWEDIACGLDFSVAIKGGKLLTCGLNTTARTGQNTTTGNTEAWTEADAATGWTSIAAGSIHGFGVKNGELYTWGSNGQGRTGLGTTTGSTVVPTKVGSDTDWSHGTCGSDFTMVIKTNGGLWGFGRGGRIGDGTATQRNNPVQVGEDTDWTKVDANALGTVALTQYNVAIKGGKLVGAGNNSDGVLNRQPDLAESLEHIEIVPETGWLDVAAGQGWILFVKG
jgi:alpha-tubulin suppressor-like RCC1 family protein